MKKLIFFALFHLLFFSCGDDSGGYIKMDMSLAGSISWLDNVCEATVYIEGEKIFTQQEVFLSINKLSNTTVSMHFSFSPVITLYLNEIRVIGEPDNVSFDEKTTCELFEIYNEKAGVDIQERDVSVGFSGYMKSDAITRGGYYLNFNGEFNIEAVIPGTEDICNIEIKITRTNYI